MLGMNDGAEHGRLAFVSPITQWLGLVLLADSHVLPHTAAPVVAMPSIGVLGK